MTGYTILDRQGRRLAVVPGPAVEDATRLAREVYGDVGGWVVRTCDGLTISHHPNVGRRHTAPWPPTEDAPANRTECPVWAALWRPSTTVEIATETDLPRREVKATLLAYLAAGRVEWEMSVWSRAPDPSAP